MGVSFDAWRAAIGCFSPQQARAIKSREDDHCFTCYAELLFSSLHTSLDITLSSLLLSILTNLYLCSLLLLSGDIEENPGPSHQPSSSHTYVPFSHSHSADHDFAYSSAIVAHDHSYSTRASSSITVHASLPLSSRSDHSSAIHMSSPSQSQLFNLTFANQHNLEQSSAKQPPPATVHFSSQSNAVFSKLSDSDSDSDSGTAQHASHSTTLHEIDNYLDESATLLNAALLRKRQWRTQCVPADPILDIQLSDGRHYRYCTSYISLSLR